MNNEMEIGYNDRLFNSRGIRGKLHLARFYWLREKVLKHCRDFSSILELGCFDAKTIEFFPENNFYYEGYDANWENGLSLGKEKLANNPNCKLFLCNSVNEFNPTLNNFDLSVSLETIEHLPTSELHGYIEKLASHTRHYCFISVPNEKGPFLVAKYLYKKFIFRNTPDHYSFKELWFAMTGRLDKIERVETQHKGFDYSQLLDVLKNYFYIESVEGVPFKHIGKKLNFTIGIVLRKKGK